MQESSSCFPPFWCDNGGSNSLLPNIVVVVGNPSSQSGAVKAGHPTGGVRGRDIPAGVSNGQHDSPRPKCAHRVWQERGLGVEERWIAMWIGECLQLLSGACAPQNLPSAKALSWPPDM